MGLSKDVISSLRIKLQNFQKADFDGKSVEEVKNELYEFYNIYSNVVANIGRCPVFRVRKIENGKEHSTLKDVWCPEASLVVKMGRANNIGEAMFYGALDYETAIKEVDVKVGESFSLAGYQLKEKENFVKSSVVIRPSLPFRKNLEPFEQFGFELSEFMVKEFVQIVVPRDEAKYLRSCAISSFLLDLPYKDSLLYPSVQNKNSVNIVMKEHDARNRLKLNLVLTCRCDAPNKYVVLEVKELSAEGKLRLIHDYSGKPIPLKVNAPKMSFDAIFGDKKIQTAEQEMQELLNLVSANKRLHEDT